MNRCEKAGAWVISLSVIGVSSWGLSGLNRHLIVAIDKIGEGAPTQAQTSALLNSSTQTVQKMDGLADQLSTVTPLADQVLATTNTGLQQTFQNINRKCGPDGCGTLAEANKTMAKAGDEIVQTQIAEREATPHVIAAMDEIKGAASGLNDDATDLNKILLDNDINRLLSNASNITDNANG